MYFLVAIVAVVACVLAWVGLGIAIARRSATWKKFGATIAGLLLIGLLLLIALPAYQDYGIGSHAAPPDGIEEIVVTGLRSPMAAQPAWRTSAREAEGNAVLERLSKNQAFDLQVRFALVKYFGNCRDEVDKELPEDLAAIVADGVKLDLVLLADDRYFQVAPDQVRQQIITSADVPEDVCGEEIAETAPAVQEATARFRLTSRDRVGRGTAAVVVYRNGRPVDQIAVTICVDTCSDRRPLLLDDDIDAYLSDMLADAASEPPTDASLSVFDLSKEHSAGILTLRKADSEFEYLVWPIDDRGVTGVRATLEDPYARVISETTDAAELAAKGRGLSNLIFKGDAGRRARDSLEAFLLTSRDTSGRLPSLFVRFRDGSNPTPLVFPAGLIAMNSVTDGTGFLGRHAQIVMPLPVQNYERFDECSETVYALLPDSTNQDPALKNARAAMGEPLAARWVNRAGSGNQWSSMSAFYDWAVDEPKVDTPSVFLLMSHHRNGTISMYGAPNIQAEDLAGVEFAEPSWAVLNGCESAGVAPSGSNFVERFNDSGMRAVIATHSEVPAALAGAYYSCLDRVLTKNSAASDYLLGAAHADALECLWNSSPTGAPAEGGATWGPNALKYVLLGNPYLRACAIATES